MNRKLQADLGKMDEVEFRELELRLRVAKQVRNLPFDYPYLDDKKVAEELRVTVKKLQLIKNCAVDLDLRFLALLTAKNVEWELEKSKKILDERFDALPIKKSSN